MSAPVFVLDSRDWIVIDANDACRSTLASDLVVAPPQPLATLVGAAATEAVAAFAKALPGDGSRRALYLKVATPAGRKALVLNFTRMPEHAGRLVVTIDDLAPFFDAAPPTSTDNTFRSLIQDLPIGIEIYDRSLRGIFYNAQSDVWFMYANYADSRLHEWWEPAFPDPAERGRAIREWQVLMDQARAAPGQPQTIEWRVLCSDRRYRTILFQLSMIGDHYALVFWDVSEQRRLETTLRDLASTDALTGVHNRRHFFDRAAAILRQPRGEAAAASLLMVDVDHFKSVNDRFGHRAGDQVLVAVADRCRSAMRTNDLLARIGGEEFVALLPATTLADAEQIAGRLHRAISAEPIAVGDSALRLTVSIGVASERPELSSIDMLIDSADAALYDAKRMGRDRIVLSPVAPA